MPEYEIIQKSEIIQNKFLQLDIYKECEYIFVYVNMGSEVKTTDIIKQALKDNKKIAVPKVIKDIKEMIFVEINSLDDLVKGNFGILEPLSSKEIASNNNTIILLPGLVFDSNNYRIGYGGGYYDKYLAKSKCLIKIGLAYDFQLVNTVPRYKDDICVEYIITNL